MRSVLHLIFQHREHKEDTEIHRETPLCGICATFVTFVVKYWYYLKRSKIIFPRLLLCRKEP